MLRQNIKIALLLGSWAPLLWANDLPTCSSDSQAQLEQAGACWNRQDVGCTKLLLERIQSRQPNCAQALYLKSFVLEREERYEEAKALREKANKLDPKLEDFWRNRGKYIEDTLLSDQEFSHFVLRFRGGENRDKAWRAVRYLNEAYNELGSVFGSFPDKKIEVIVMSGQEFVGTWRNPYIGGFFDLVDGKVRVRVDEDWPGGETAYRRTCRHEFTHAFVYPYVSKTTVPLWFTEGIAEFYSYRDTADGMWKEKRLKQWSQELKGAPPMTLKEIQDTIEKKSGKVVLSYYYSAMFCVQMGRERGDSWIPRMVQAMSSGRTFDQAFMDVVGVEPDRMFQRAMEEWSL